MCDTQRSECVERLGDEEGPKPQAGQDLLAFAAHLIPTGARADRSAPRQGSMRPAPTSIRHHQALV
jgi:hypothetical protein